MQIWSAPPVRGTCTQSQSGPNPVAPRMVGNQTNEAVTNPAKPSTKSAAAMSPRLRVVSQIHNSRSIWLISVLLSRSSLAASQSGPCRRRTQAHARLPRSDYAGFEALAVRAASRTFCGISSDRTSVLIRRRCSISPCLRVASHGIRQHVPWLPSRIFASIVGQ